MRRKFRKKVKALKHALGKTNCSLHSNYLEMYRLNSKLNAMSKFNPSIGQIHQNDYIQFI